VLARVQPQAVPVFWVSGRGSFGQILFQARVTTLSLAPVVELPPLNRWLL